MVGTNGVFSEMQTKPIPFRVSEKANAVIIPYIESIASVIPQARMVVKEGKKFLIVPHGDVETKLLNNLGIKVSSPMVTQYEWAGITPFASQIATACMLVNSPAAFVLSELGTGKTLSSLFAIDYLMSKGVINKCLIVAPLTTLTTVWEREIFTYFPHLSATTLHGSRDKRLARLRDKSFNFYIINHDGVKIKDIQNALSDRADIDCVLIDELTAFKNPRSTRWKAMNMICRKTSRKYVWGMTGSPTPQSPMDAYGQIKLIAPSRIQQNYTAFKDRLMRQLTAFKWVARDNANDILSEVMQPAVRFTRDQCMDLPPCLYTSRQTDMSAEQMAAYKQMKNQSVITGNAVEVTAVNAAVQVAKLLQISCGFAYGMQGGVIDLDIRTKLSAVKEIIDEASKKVVIYVPFVYAMNTLTKALRAEYGEDAVASVSGDTGKTERDNIFNLFQNSNRPRILVAHPQCVAHGLTLTAANTIVWFSPTMSAEIYQQANGRITRPGQDSHQLIVHLEASKTESRMYKVLQERGDMQSILLAIMKELTN